MIRSQSGFAGDKNIMKMMAITMFGYDVSDHESIENGIVHEREKPSGFHAAKMALHVSAMM